jgi:hypothetical protein
MFEITTQHTSAGPRYSIINTATGLPAVTWYNAGEPNEMVGFTDHHRAQAMLEQFERGWLRDVRRPDTERKSDRRSP